MEEPATPPAVPEKLFTFQDYLFLSYLAFCMFCVAWVGRMAYEEGMRNEVTKRNGELWAKWFTEASPERSKPEYALAVCSTIAAPVATAVGHEEAPVHSTPVSISEAGEAFSPLSPESKSGEAAKPAPPPRTWGPCLQALTEKGGPLADMVNPFNKQALALVPKCDMTDRALAGALVLEKIVATPPGSAIPSVNSQLIESDPIDQKMQIRITVCDKGAYPIRIAELDF